MNPYNLLRNPRLYEWKSKLLSVGRPSVREYLLSLPGGAGMGRVLDLGCGTGRHAALFAGNYVGIDREPKYVAFAKKRYHGHFLVMDAARLGFPDASFETAFAVGLCHHLHDERVRVVLREMKRVIRQDGLAVVVDAVLPPKSNLPGQVLFRLDRGGHTRTLDQMAKLVALENFELATANIPGSFPYQRAAFLYRA
jgi:SAM-dependent methyltransferase